MVKVEVNGTTSEMMAGAESLATLLGYSTKGEIICKIMELLSQGKTVEYYRPTEQTTYTITPIKLSQPPENLVES